MGGVFFSPREGAYSRLDVMAMARRAARGMVVSIIAVVDAVIHAVSAGGSSSPCGGGGEDIGDRIMYAANDVASADP